MFKEMIKKNTSEHFLLKQLVKKNFTAKYKDSILGILWSFINPLLTMLLLTAIFSTIFSGNIANYPVYFLTGRCLFDFFSSGTKIAMNSIKSNSGILKRIFVPRYIFAFGGVCSEFINFIISLIILVAVMYLTGLPLTLMSLAAIVPMAILFIMILGIGLILSIVCTYFRDIEYLYNIFTMLLMYASALFYPAEIIPEALRQYLYLNPLFLLIDQFRDILMYHTLPNIMSVINTGLFSLIVLISGIIIFTKYQKKITLEL
ncbi:ABC transporter permease [uncultured Methanobrevibacter sp.]|uniref:ABC transporter permease n=1 Tax=uncultured Methanobrevibacter sp. TaxID=253161 RepID=UPI0026200EAE|nr:ABC transporter permease [uncultured Methanobrevibacter sp.]